MSIGVTVLPLGDKTQKRQCIRRIRVLCEDFGEEAAARIKTNFKNKYSEAKAQLAMFAASQHHLNDKLVKALARIEELEYENRIHSV